MAENNMKARFTAPEAKVLVVDDLPANIRIVKELMSPCGVKTFVSLSGEKAIELIQKDTFDLVFMDQMMPEMDGMETISRIRALAENGGDKSGYYRTLPIVLLTANAVTETKEELDRLGINGYITKPINPARLFDTIEKLLPPEKITASTK